MQRFPRPREAIAQERSVPGRTGGKKSRQVRPGAGDDPQHLRPHVREHHRRERPRQKRREIEDLQTFQRSGHFMPPFLSIKVP